MVTSITIKEAAADFLAAKRIAVAGVSRSEDSAHGGNVVYKRLRDRGYEVFPVNPNAEQVEGDPCYPDLAAIPGGVEAVVIATGAEHAPRVMRDCVAAGVPKVWMHRSFGPGSVSDEATQIGREAGITVIPGGCPLMFEPCDDGGHRFMRVLLQFGGKVPKKVETAAQVGG